MPPWTTTFNAVWVLHAPFKAREQLSRTRYQFFEFNIYIYQITLNSTRGLQKNQNKKPKITLHP
jgi:hypothetical protein